MISAGSTSSSARIVTRSAKQRRHRRSVWSAAAAATAAAVLAPAGVVLLTGPSARAATDTWTGLTDTEWGTGGNWTGGNAPPQTGDTVVFSGTTALNSDHNLGNGFSLGGLQFSTGAGAFVLTSHAGANDQSLALTGALVDNSAAGTGTSQTINFAINSTSSLSIGSDKSGGNNMVLGASDTFASMSVGSNSTVSNTLNIGSTTITVNGATAIGSAPVAGTGTISTTLFNVTGSGTWSVNSATNTNFSVGVGASNNNNGNAEATLDMTGLANFSFTTGTGNFGVGYKVTRPASVAKLANTSNSITAALIGVGDSNQNGNGTDNNNNQNLANILDLGAGTNSFQTNSLIIGQTKTPGVVQYITPTGSISIKGEAGGTSTANITVANMTGGSAPALGSSLLLANNNASAATVQAGAVIIGNSNGITSGTSTGLVTFDTGTFSATSLSLGTVSGGNFSGLGGATGTFTLGTNSSSTGVLTVTGNFTLAGDTNTNSNGGTATGTFTINGGTANLNSNMAITTTAAAIHTNTVATLNLTGGVLNMNGFAIGNVILSGVGSVTVNLPDTGQTATIENLGGNGIYATNGTGTTSSGLVMGGNGTLILAGTNNSYTGPTTVNAGILQIGSGSLAGSVPAGTTFTNNTTVNFDGNQPMTIAAGIGGGGVVNQNGTGTTTLSGSNTYGGNTTINNGVLSVTGSISGNVNISPTNTGGTLAGTGSIGGATTLNTGGAIHPGATGADLSVGTLNLSSLTVNGGDMRFDLGGSTSDLLNISGNASFSGGTISLALDSAPTVSSYTVLTAASGITGSPTLSTTSIGRTTFSLAMVGNSLKINVGGGPANLIWNNSGNPGPTDGTTWDVQTNKNWHSSPAPAAGDPNQFYSNDAVTFNDANNGHNAVSITTQVSPGSVTFANNTANYVFSGAGGISGTTNVTLNGAASVTLQTANTYGGNTNVNAGTLILASGGSIAGGNLNIAGGAVNINSGGSVGTPNINVNSGSLSIASGGSISNSLAVVTVAGGASMTVASGATIPTTLNLVDNGTVTLNGATTLGTLGGTGVVSLNAATLTVSGGGTVGNVLQDGSVSNLGSLNVPAGPALILTADSTYTSNTTINSGGSLQLGNGGTTGSLSAASNISNSGTLTYNLNNPSGSTIANTITNIGTLVFNSAGNLNVTGTITGAGQVRQTGAGTTSLSGNISGLTGGFILGGGGLTFNYASPTTIPNTIGVVAGTTSTISNVGKLTMSGTESVGSTTGAITYNVSPATGSLPSGTNADVELTGSINRTTGSDGIGIVKTGTGVLAISGATDNASLGVTVNAGTVLLNKTSATTIHAIGGGGMQINNGGTVMITGTGGEQLYNAAGTVTINNGGTFDLNGQSQGFNNLTMGNATGAGLLTDSVASTSVLVKVGTAVGQVNDTGTPAATAIGRLSLGGDTNVSVATGSSLELQGNGLGATGGNHTLTNIGPGNVTLSGVADNSAVNVAVTSGMLILAKTSTSTVHATSTVTGVSSGATLQLSGTGGDQIFDGFVATPPATQNDYGVLNMNGTFDMNGQTEGFDKLTGTGGVINSQSGTPVTLTLGTNSGLGPTTPEFAGTISGNIALTITQGTTMPPAPIILDGLSTYSGNTNVNAGTLQINPGGGITGSTNVTVASGAQLNAYGSLSSSAVVTANGTTNFGAPNSTAASTQQIASLSIGPNVTATVTVSVNAALPKTLQTLQPSSLTFGDPSTSRLDLTNNILISPGTVAQAEALVSTLSPNVPTVITSDVNLALGYGDAGGGNYEIRATLLGDSDLDGKVNVADLANLAGNFGKTAGQLWINGDFDYNGNVNVADLADLAGNFGKQLGVGSGGAGATAAEAAAPSAVVAGGAAVPEPTSLALLGLGALQLTFGRRQRRRRYAR
jgi:autotransporter-associated beta strand protein